MAVAATSLPVTALRRGVSGLARARLAINRRAGHFAGRQVYSEARANDWIRDRVADGRPLLVARLGSVEMDLWHAGQGVLAHRGQSAYAKLKSLALGYPAEWPQALLESARNNAGFFPCTDDNLLSFAAELERSVARADLMAIWHSRTEETMLNRFNGQCLLAEMKGIEPYYYEKPWTLALKGKRLLAIHPFAASIERQFAQRHRLFGGRTVFPEGCSLVTLKAAQTIAGETAGYPSWFAALDHMREKVLRTEFDVAVIGAGAYGLPLAAFIKDIGKQAIHLGGATQILFGIRGKRWDDRPEVSSFYNEYWVSPDPSETPRSFRRVEGGCYW